MSGIAPEQRVGRLGIVPARFGPKIVGGAEIVLRHIAEGLQGRGWDVEILTTAATDYFAWENDQPVGVREEDGLTVRLAYHDVGQRHVPPEEAGQVQPHQQHDQRVEDLAQAALRKPVAEQRAVRQ